MSRDRQPPAAAHGAIPATEACASLLVDLDAVRDNWRTAARLSGSAQCAAVVKGDAYGTGLEPVARALMDAGARTFFAATIGEARRVRACCGPSPVVYVLNGCCRMPAKRSARRTCARCWAPCRKSPSGARMAAARLPFTWIRA